MDTEAVGYPRTQFFEEPTMIRIITAVFALTAVGCGASQTSQDLSHSGDQVVLERTPYAQAFAEAFDTYEQQVHLAMSLPYGSEAEAEAVIQTMSSQRFDGLLVANLEARGLSRADFANYLARDEAFFSQLRATYHGRIEHLASDVTRVRELVVVADDEADDEAEIAMLVEGAQSDR